MKSDVPWQVKGVRPQARETAREAARRSGMSVGEWLDNVILDSALHDGVEPKPRTQSQYDPYDDDDEDLDRDKGAYHDQELGLRPGEYPGRSHSAVPEDRYLPAGYEERQRPAPRGRPDHPARPEERRQSAAESARQHAAELADRLSLAPVEEDRPVVDQGFATLHDRLDNLTRQLGHLAEMNAASAQVTRPEPRVEEPQHQLVEVISKLDRRFDELIAEARSAKTEIKTEIEQRANAVDRAVADLKPRAALATEPPTQLDQALIEIADRQRTLDGYVSVASGGASAHAAVPSETLPRARTQELSGLEQQLRQINTQIETLRQPCSLDKAVDTLRDDLAEIGLMLQEAMPRKAVEALEAEVRKLADRLDNTRHADTDGAALAGIERGLGEMRDALRALTPAESLVGVDRAVQHLSQKIDLIGGNAQDPAAFKQLEGAIVAMRGIVSHVASNDALAKLSEEVRALGHKVDQAASPASGGVLTALEGRIAMLADALEARNRSGQNVPHELETVVAGLIDKIERVQLTRGDQAALGHLEDRIAKLVEKLDASDARLNHLESIERGLAELLVHLEHQRMPSLARVASSPPEADVRSRHAFDPRQTAAAPVPAEVLAPPIAPAAPAFEELASEPSPRAAVPKATAPGSPADTSQPIEFGAGPQPPKPMAPPKPTAPSAPERRPIDPNLPPDHPLEPGSSAARGRNPGSPADRIAASEAALGGARPPVIPDPSGKSNFIAAARRAAQAAGRDAPPKNDASTPSEGAEATGKLSSRVGMLRGLIGGATALVLVLGSLQIAWNLFGSSDEAEVSTSSVPSPAPATPAPDTPAPAAADPATSAPSAPVATPAVGRQSALFPAVDGTTIATPALGIVIPAETARPASTERESTGTVSQPAKATGAPIPLPVPAPGLAAAQTPPAPASSAITADKLPVAFSSSLRAAAAKGDPAAQYEVALRYAEGRGVTQNLTDAAEWFERAAKQGLVPAQFRLGGFYEKGLGVTKNLETARRFYAAAGEAGNAKALHNLAVLYAEGIDGKPDYQTAARWFRKAADYGVADSQYNLAILCTRGIGVEQNLAEAYKWFALAARDGDADAAKKRDDIGSRLDQQSLKAATQAVQGWAPERQPDGAVQVKTPAGGWDSAGAAAPAVASAPAKRKPSAAGPKLDLSTPRLTQ